MPRIVTHLLNSVFHVPLLFDIFSGEEMDRTIYFSWWSVWWISQVQCHAIYACNGIPCTHLHEKTQRHKKTHRPRWVLQAHRINIHYFLIKWNIIYTAKNTTGLLQVDEIDNLLQVEESTCIKLVNSSLFSTTCNKLVNNLHQACYHQVDASHANASWYGLITSLVQVVNKLVASGTFLAVYYSMYNVYFLNPF